MKFRFILLFVALFFVICISLVIIIENCLPFTYGGSWENIEPQSCFKAPLRKNELIVVEALLGSKKIHLMIDTGSTDSVLLSDVLHNITISKRKLPIPIYYGGSRLNIKFVQRVILQEALKIGPYSGKGMEWMVVDRNEDTALSIFSEMYGINIDGVIGRNILNNFTMLLDFDNQELVLQRNEENVPVFDRLFSTTVPINRKSEIPVSIRNKKERMLIDTGYNGLIDLYTVGLSFPKEAIKESVSYNGFNQVNSTYIEVELEIKIGDIEVTCSPVSENISLRNLFAHRKAKVGMSFISKFNWFFNFKKNEVTIIIPEQ